MRTAVACPEPPVDPPQRRTAASWAVADRNSALVWPAGLTPAVTAVSTTGTSDHWIALNIQTDR